LSSHGKSDFQFLRSSFRADPFASTYAVSERASEQSVSRAVSSSRMNSQQRQDTSYIASATQPFQEVIARCFRVVLTLMSPVSREAPGIGATRADQSAGRTSQDPQQRRPDKRYAPPRLRRAFCHACAHCFARTTDPYQRQTRQKRDKPGLIDVCYASATPSIYAALLFARKLTRQSMRDSGATRRLSTPDAAHHVPGYADAKGGDGGLR